VSIVAYNVGSVVLQTVKRLAEVGLGAFLKAAGIDPEQFKATLARFGQAVQILKDIVNTGVRTFARNVFDGVVDGFRQFAGGFPGNVANAALAWLFNKVSAIAAVWQDVMNQLPRSLTFREVTLFLLKVAGLTFTRLTDTLRMLGYRRTADALNLLKNKLGDPPDLARIEQQIRDYTADPSNSADQIDLSNVQRQLVDALPGILASWAVRQVPRLVAMFAFPAAGALRAIWKTVQWVVRNAGTIASLVGAVAGALQGAAQGPSYVAQKVLQGIGLGIRLLLDFIAGLLGVDSLVNSVAGSVNRVLSWLRDQVTKLLIWVLKKFGFRRDVGETCRIRRPGSCWVESVKLKRAQGDVPIRAIRLGMRVMTIQPGERVGLLIPDQIVYSAAELRAIYFAVTDEDGNRVKIGLLRNVDWLRAHGVEVGRPVWLDMPEMGVEGYAVVTAVEPCPPLEEGEGQLVTGIFEHRASHVLDLLVEGEPEPLGVTPTHLVWSVDRQDWVSVKDLRRGERLLSLKGPVVVKSLTSRTKPEPVHNIEVDGDHCYRVGQQGLLVHNQSAPTTAPAPCCPPPVTSPRSATLGTNLGSGPDADVNSTTVSNQPQAHHIVAGSARGASNSRMILFDPPVCIGINDAINGVWLPKTSGVTVAASTNPLGRVFHNQTFSPLYHAYGFGRLNPVRGNRMAVENRLRLLRQELIAGTVSW
jgi:hypothetical protein